MHIFPVVRANHILENCVKFNVVWVGVNRAGKFALTSHSGISISDRIKNKEQNKSIMTGPLYVPSEFEAPT